jgi:hypothetical protein
VERFSGASLVPSLLSVRLKKPLLIPLNGWIPVGVAGLSLGEGVLILILAILTTCRTADVAIEVVKLESPEYTAVISGV